MKKFLLAVVLFTCGAAQASVFKYSMSDGTHAISGAFEGTANGNLITQLSNISLAVDGIEVKGSGNLYSAKWVYESDTRYYWAPGAIVSFDGTENNFMFVNSDYLAKDFTYTALLYSTGWDNDNHLTIKSSWSHYIIDSMMIGTPASFGWTVSAVSEVPEPASLALMGLGLAGLGALRRRQN